MRPCSTRSTATAARASRRSQWSTCTKDRLIGKIMGGNPVFRGTRVPVHRRAELVPSRVRARTRCRRGSTSTTTGVQFLIGMDNKQKEAKAKENNHSRCRDKAEGDEGEQGCDIGLRCPGPLSRGIGERNRRFGRLWTRVSTRTSRPELSRQLVEQPLSEHSAAFPLTHPRIQAATGDRKAPALSL